MDAIAEAAGVNKALLYYYFHDKDALYGAVLDSFFAACCSASWTVCDQPGTAGRALPGYARGALRLHRRVAALRAHLHGRADERQPRRLAASGSHSSPSTCGPSACASSALVQEGIDSGEFRRVEPTQFVPSAIGSIVHYFLTAPLRQQVPCRTIPHSPEPSIERRRAAVLDFIAAALFADRDAGIELAARDCRRRKSCPAILRNQHSSSAHKRARETQVKAA